MDWHAKLAHVIEQKIHLAWSLLASTPYICIPFEDPPHWIGVSLNLKAWKLKTKHVGYRNSPTAYLLLWSSHQQKYPDDSQLNFIYTYGTNSPISFYKGQVSDSTDIDGINMMLLKDMINRSWRTVGSATAAAMKYCHDIRYYFWLDIGTLHHAFGIWTNFHSGITKFQEFLVSTKLTHDQ